ncbi:hypothetical protein JCM10449v2_007764 [Rhodotorula kratochvilovae]
MQHSGHHSNALQPHWAAALVAERTGSRDGRDQVGYGKRALDGKERRIVKRACYGHSGEHGVRLPLLSASDTTSSLSLPFGQHMEMSAAALQMQLVAAEVARKAQPLGVSHGALSGMLSLGAGHPAAQALFPPVFPAILLGRPAVAALTPTSKSLFALELAAQQQRAFEPRSLAGAVSTEVEAYFSQLAEYNLASGNGARAPVPVAAQAAPAVPKAIVSWQRIEPAPIEPRPAETAPASRAPASTTTATAAPPALHGCTWTPSEDAALRTLRAHGQTLAQAAAALGRTFHAVKGRWAAMQARRERAGGVEAAVEPADEAVRAYVARAFVAAAAASPVAAPADRAACASDPVFAQLVAVLRSAAATEQRAKERRCACDGETVPPPLKRGKAKRKLEFEGAVAAGKRFRALVAQGGGGAAAQEGAVEQARVRARAHEAKHEEVMGRVKRKDE